MGVSSFQFTDPFETLKLAPHDDRGGVSVKAERHPMLDKVLSAGVRNDASDIHINVGKKPVIRKDMALIELNTVVLDPEACRALIKSCATEQKIAELDKDGSCNFAFTFDPPNDPMSYARFRVNASKSQGETKITFRRLPKDLLTPDQIGLTKQVMQCLDYDRGLILVTGPTGSGKTTTLAAMVVHLLNSSNRNHVYMIEDPTEYQIDQGKGLLTQREVEVDTPSYERGLHDALRSNPNVIVVGEMRTKATISAALTAAETGHLVLATLHTTSAATTVQRIVDTFPGDEKDSVRSMLSTSIRGIICQQLLPRMGGGKIAAYEFLSMNDGIANKIRDGDFFAIQSLIELGQRKYGMFTLDQSLAKLCIMEKVKPLDAFLKANRRASFLEELVQAPSLKGTALELASEYNVELKNRSQ